MEPNSDARWLRSLLGPSLTTVAADLVWSTSGGEYAADRPILLIAVGDRGLPLLVSLTVLSRGVSASGDGPALNRGRALGSSRELHHGHRPREREYEPGHRPQILSGEDPPEDDGHHADTDERDDHRRRVADVPEVDVGQPDGRHDAENRSPVRPPLPSPPARRFDGRARRAVATGSRRARSRTTGESAPARQRRAADASRRRPDSRGESNPCERIRLARRAATAARRTRVAPPPRGSSVGTRTVVRALSYRSVGRGPVLRPCRSYRGRRFTRRSAVVPRRSVRRGGATRGRAEHLCRRGTETRP